MLTAFWHRLFGSSAIGRLHGSGANFAQRRSQSLRLRRSASAPVRRSPPALIGAILGPAQGLTPSAREGSATPACGLSGCACAVIAARRRTHRAPVERGWSPPSDRSRMMSQPLKTAYARAWNLATTLMVCITVFKAGDGDFGVMPSAEFDGDPASILHEFDPFEP